MLVAFLELIEKCSFCAFTLNARKVFNNWYDQFWAFIFQVRSKRKSEWMRKEELGGVQEYKKTTALLFFLPRFALILFQCYLLAGLFWFRSLFSGLIHYAFHKLLIFLQIFHIFFDFAFCFCFSFFSLLILLFCHFLWSSNDVSMRGVLFRLMWNFP